jgi:hypothetical protein
MQRNRHDAETHLSPVQRLHSRLECHAGSQGVLPDVRELPLATGTAVARLQSGAGEAVDALRRKLSCGRPGDEMRAAVAIIDHAARGVELLDLTDRIEALEALEKARKGRR